ncbi:MAG TPA: FtsX-like permease family protein [Desulfotignum sp.]|nr:FtsX-like permease family protein [Desulfotignum sp.]
MLTLFHKKKDFQIHVPLALLKQAEATKRTFNIVLGAIAGISLLVGGIGIMNIMLASVTERIREIGIRRAIGAKRRQIIIQFLIEAVVLSFIGGIIGLMLGMAIPFFITWFAKMPTVITPLGVLLPLSVSLGIGIVFGLYPAARAARVDPIIALRHE